jgi:hypothetical protein
MLRAAYTIVVFVIRHAFRAVASLLWRAVAVAPLAFPLYAAGGTWLAAMVVGLPGWACIVLPAAIIVGMVAALGDEGRRFSLARLEEELRALATVSRERLAAGRVRRRWAETCTALGWDRGKDKEPVRRSELRHVERVGYQLRLAWAPRGDQLAKQWPTLVDALRRRLGAFSAEWREDPGAPGTTVAVFGLVPLPVRVEADTLLRGVEPGAENPPDGAPPVAAAANHVVLGTKAGGGDAMWVPAEVPHLLVVGATGRGQGRASPSPRPPHARRRLAGPRARPEGHGREPVGARGWNPRRARPREPG